jgi:hypothetical protein
MATKNGIIATSATKDGLTKCINDYFYATNAYTLGTNGKIIGRTGNQLKNFSWVLKRGRYQFIDHNNL